GGGLFELPLVGRQARRGRGHPLAVFLAREPRAIAATAAHGRGLGQGRTAAAPVEAAVGREQERDVDPPLDTLGVEVIESEPFAVSRRQDKRSRNHAMSAPCSAASPGVSQMTGAPAAFTTSSMSSDLICPAP